MSGNVEGNLSSSSKTNWKRIDIMTDDDIDTSDSPPLTDELLAKAKWLMPGESASHQKEALAEHD
jgi:hypothetical protein